MPNLAPLLSGEGGRSARPVHILAYSRSHWVSDDLRYPSAIRVPSFAELEFNELHPSVRPYTIFCLRYAAGAESNLVQLCGECGTISKL